MNAGERFARPADHVETNGQAAEKSEIGQQLAGRRLPGVDLDVPDRRGVQKPLVNAAQDGEILFLLGPDHDPVRPERPHDGLALDEEFGVGYNPGVTNPGLPEDLPGSADRVDRDGALVDDDDILFLGAFVPAAEGGRDFPGGLQVVREIALARFIDFRRRKAHENGVAAVQEFLDLGVIGREFNPVPVPDEQIAEAFLINARFDLIAVSGAELGDFFRVHVISQGGVAAVGRDGG
jgi:hypothetical protein